MSGNIYLTKTRQNNRKKALSRLIFLNYFICTFFLPTLKMVKLVKMELIKILFEFI